MILNAQTSTAQKQNKSNNEINVHLLVGMGLVVNM